MAFSYQLYSSRNHGPLPDTLKMLADLGYTRVEGFGGLLDDLGALKAQLDEAGLAMPTVHVGLPMIEDRPDHVARLTDLGVGTVFCPAIPKEDRPDTAAGWEDMARRLDRAAAPLRDAGLAVGWHNHDFEFRPLSDGSRAIDAMFEAAPDLVWEADIAWVTKGGADPFAEIERYADRIVAVHVKDIAPDGEAQEEDGWADVGHGTLPWTRLMTSIRERTQAEHFVMEHDNPSDDRRFAERSLAAAKGL